MIINKLYTFIFSTLIVTTCSGMNHHHRNNKHTHTDTIQMEADRLESYRKSDETFKLNQDEAVFNLTRSNPIWNKVEKFFPTYELDHVLGFIETCREINPTLKEPLPYSYYHLAPALVYIYDNRRTIEKCAEEILEKNIEIRTVPVNMPESKNRYDGIFYYKEYLRCTKTVNTTETIRRYGRLIANSREEDFVRDIGLRRSIFKREREKLFPDKVFPDLVVSFDTNGQNQINI